MSYVYEFKDIIVLRDVMCYAVYKSICFIFFISWYVLDVVCVPGNKILLRTYNVYTIAID